MYLAINISKCGAQSIPSLLIKSQHLLCLRNFGNNLGLNFPKTKCFFLYSSSQSCQKNCRYYISDKHKNITKNRYAFFVPMGVLLFIIWAFVYGGLNLKQPENESLLNYPKEKLYVSKVEKLLKEKQERQTRRLKDKQETNGKTVGDIDVKE